MRIWLASGIVLAMGILVGTAHAEADAAAGKVKSATCAACHGADGNSASPEFPKLAGQGAPYLVQELKEFKDGTRKNPLMTPMAQPLTEQDMADLAAFYAGEKIQVGKATQASVEMGQELYRGGNAATGVAACMSCHGPDGAGNSAAKFPLIGGQHAAYVAGRLKMFKEGELGQTPGNAMMQSIAARMTSAEIKAVADYISGLH